MTCYQITLNLFYVHKENSFSSNDSGQPDEPELSPEEVDIFMKGNMPRSDEPRYLYYAQSVAYTLTCGNRTLSEEDELFDIEYEDGGILKFVIQLDYEETDDTLKRTILLDSFEDSMMEGELGNECLVSSREKHPIKIVNNSNNPSIYCMDYYELGHIDCRANHCIQVKKI
jgi:hypothetical protein